MAHGTSHSPSPGQKDGWPARLRRSLAIDGLSAVLGRFRPDRGNNLTPEQMDVLAIDERGRAITAPQRSQEAILEEILLELKTMNETLMERLR